MLSRAWKLKTVGMTDNMQVSLASMIRERLRSAGLPLESVFGHRLRHAHAASHLINGTLPLVALSLRQPVGVSALFASDKALISSSVVERQKSCSRGGDMIYM